jgi:hypothetical protein
MATDAKVTIGITADQAEKKEPRHLTPEERAERSASAFQEQQKLEEQQRRDLAAVTDRFGVLSHFKDRYDIPGHPSEFSIAGKAGKVKVTFSFEREVDGKVQKITKTVTGADVSAAAEKLRPELAEALAALESK